MCENKCLRCGDDENRIDGYCSTYCRDMAEAERENAALREEYLSACDLVANMHKAAVGEITGPVNGVVEDIANLRAENVALRATIQDARTVILRGVELMTEDQVGQWDGVRAWLEQAKE